MAKKFTFGKGNLLPFQFFEIKEEVASASTNKSDLAERAHFLPNNLDEKLDLL